MTLGARAHRPHPLGVPGVEPVGAGVRVEVQVEEAMARRPVERFLDRSRAGIVADAIPERRHGDRIKVAPLMSNLTALTARGMMPLPTISTRESAP